MNKALLDTDIYSEVLKAVDPTVAQNAASYRQQHGVYTLSVITLMEIVQGFQRVQTQGGCKAFWRSWRLRTFCFSMKPPPSSPDASRGIWTASGVPSVGAIR